MEYEDGAITTTTTVHDAIQMILVFLLNLAILSIVPNAGAKKGIQYLTMIRSGFRFLTDNPDLIQLKGLTELIHR